ncbi:MAG: DinB family protein [Saprospiraceae bacterium]|nr:DinB family protein [Saprospiraceae bacterium]
MKVESGTLLTELKRETIQNAEFARSLKNLNDQQLNFRENPEKWSILECLEHLNLYGDYYIPAIKKAIQNSNSSTDEFFECGLLGNYFANTMLPKQKLNKMKTFKDKNPLNIDLDRNVIERFMQQQHTLIDLLEKSESISLNKVRINISISRWIKLKLGDTFRFVINHNIRHIRQIQDIADKLNISPISIK